MAQCMLEGPNAATATTPVWDGESEIFIVDVEGFQIKQDFFIKELAFYNPYSKQMWSGVFHAPFDRAYLKKKGQECIEYASSNLHGLRWEQGQYPYSMSYHLISHFGKKGNLYAKGSQKCVWLQQYTTSPVTNLEVFGCPPPKDLPQAYLCIEHSSLEKACAMDKAIRLGNYMASLWEMKNVA